MGKFLFGLMLLAYAAGVVFFAVSQIHGHPIQVLDPQGIVASKERNLMIIATILMLIVVIPVFIFTFTIAWKYRASNTKATYAPEWDYHPALEVVWWLVPTAIISVLAVIAWQSSHELDPYQPLASATPPMTIQVVALQWKWLFIYPQQQIATVNYMRIPEQTPINFEITADAPMNSFWIPQLGGQIYAMPGMETQLHLMASHPGSFNGSSANISGDGFASMHFVTQASSGASFQRWVSSVQRSPQQLSLASYQKLARPGESPTPRYYFVNADNLFDTIMMKFMAPSSVFNGNLTSVNQS